MEILEADWAELDDGVGCEEREMVGAKAIWFWFFITGWIVVPFSEIGDLGEGLSRVQFSACGIGGAVEELIWNVLSSLRVSGLCVPVC